MLRRSKAEVSGFVEMPAMYTFDSAQQARLEDALTRAGVRYTLDVYAGARHGFAVTGHLVYDKDASERHWAQAVQLFGEALGPARSE